MPSHGPNSAAAAQPRGLRILMVEDHPDSSRVMARLLSISGHGVHAVSGVQAALAAAAKQDFDLLISDIGLPDGSGLELMRQLTARRPAQPIRGIAITGRTSPEDEQRSREAGFLAHVAKPVDFDTLDKLIREMA
jgi:CheY-like chemotaxis protein